MYSNGVNTLHNLLKYNDVDFNVKNCDLLYSSFLVFAQNDQEKS